MSLERYAECGCCLDHLDDIITDDCKYAALKASHAELVEFAKVMIGIWDIRKNPLKIHEQPPWEQAARAALKKAEALK